jgi:hypothetical protein
MNILQRFIKGDKCEEKIYRILLQHLKNINSNTYIIPKYYGPYGEIDLLIIDPILGILVLDIKNWKYFSSELELKKALNILKRHNDIILDKLKEKFSYVPINTDFKLVFCQKPPEKLLKSEWVKALIQSKKIIIADETGNFIKDLFEVNYSLNDDKVINTKEIFEEILKTLSIIDSKEEELASKNASNREDFGRIYITREGILHLDIKFSSILSSYRKGLRIIRGLAGTGKTVILTNLVLKNPNKRFLFLCFNNLLKSNLEKFFSERNVNNVMVLSIIGLLHKTVTESKKYQQLDAKWNYIKNNLNKVKYSLGKFFKENQIDIIIIDEAQDFIPEILRIIFELNSNLVIGIDEGQKIYHYGTSDIKKEVFPDISLQGKVINLRTIYRTPENIAKTAIQILALDDSLHPYYRSEYLERKQEIKYLLPGGRIYKILRQRDIFHQILNYLESLEEDYMVLVPSYKFKQRFNEKLDFVKVPSGKMAYIDSVKGLEADNIIILGFNEYLIQNIKYNTELIYRRLYTMLTRSKKRIFIDLYRDYFEEILNRINKKGEVSSDSLKKLKTAYLTLEKQSIKWSKENQIENLEEKEFTGVLNSISFAKEGFIKTFEKLTPIVEFLANIKGLIG